MIGVILLFIGCFLLGAISTYYPWKSFAVSLLRNDLRYIRKRLQVEAIQLDLANDPAVIDELSRIEDIRLAAHLISLDLLISATLYMKSEEEFTAIASTNPAARELLSTYKQLVRGRVAKYILRQSVLGWVAYAVVSARHGWGHQAIATIQISKWLDSDQPSLLAQMHS